MELEVQIHGMTCMFQSKRSLVGNYFEYQGRNLDIEKEKNMKRICSYMTQSVTINIQFMKMKNGTHIMSPNDICFIDELEELIEAEVDSLKIDGVLKSSEYIIEVTKKYRQAIDLCVEDRGAYYDVKDDLYKEIEEMQPVNRPLDTGFFFKETVY